MSQEVPADSNTQSGPFEPSGPDKRVRSVFGSRKVGGASPPKIASIYLILQVALLVNEGAYRAGLPAFQVGVPYVTSPIGVAGLLANGLIGLGILGLALKAGQVGRQQRRALTAVGLMTLPAAISGVVLGSPLTLRSLAISAASLGVVAASMIAGRRLLVILSLAGGAMWTWGSVAVGLLELLQALGISQTIDPDLSGRYREWVGFLGLNVDPSFGALVGLSTGRAVIAETVVLLVLVYLRAVPLFRPHVPIWLYTLALSGAVAALSWSLSRVSVIALIVGLSFAFLPWGRLSRYRGTAPVLAALFLTVSVVPLVIASLLPAGFATTNTVTWRMSVWSWYLNQPGLLMPFGRGPQFSSLGVSHPHHQMLETWGTGGLLGLAAFGVGLYLLTASTVMSSVRDNGLAVGALASVVTYGIFQMVVSPSHYALGFVWVVFLIILGASSTCAASPATRDGANWSTRP